MYWTTVVTYVQHVVSRHSLIVGAWHAQRGVTVLSCEQTDLSKVSVTSAYHRRYAAAASTKYLPRDALRSIAR